MNVFSLVRSLLIKYWDLKIPVDVDYILSALDVDVEYIDNDNVTAVIYYDSSKYQLKLTYESTVSDRYRKAHALGHILLKHVKQDSPYIIRKESYKLNSDNENYLANIFAMRVLVPLPAIKEYAKHISDIDKLAETFKVNRNVIRLRLKDAGIIR